VRNTNQSTASRRASEVGLAWMQIQDATSGSVTFKVLPLTSLYIYAQADASISLDGIPSIFIPAGNMMIINVGQGEQNEEKKVEVEITSTAVAVSKAMDNPKPLGGN
jgi:hypothetical protein